MYKIHKEGHKIILTIGIVLLVANVLIGRYIPINDLLLDIIRGISVAFFLFSIAFFRIPLRRTHLTDNNVVIAPADGKVVVVEEVDEKEYFKDRRIQVSIFMSPTNIHVNKSPISGKVSYTKYHPGNYLVAWHPKSSELNERFTSVIKNSEQEFEILVRQIAGKVARKISNYLDEGQETKQGQEMGFIKFGSRVDLFFPVGTKINVSLKDKVKGGKTVLAYLEK